MPLNELLEANTKKRRLEEENDSDNQEESSAKRVKRDESPANETVNYDEKLETAVKKYESARDNIKEFQNYVGGFEENSSDESSGGESSEEEDSYVEEKKTTVLSSNLRKREEMDNEIKERYSEAIAKDMSDNEKKSLKIKELDELINNSLLTVNDCIPEYTAGGEEIEALQDIQKSLSTQKVELNTLKQEFNDQRSTPEKSSLLDDFADLTTEPTDYIGGDD